MERRFVPISLKQANEFILMHHRHNKKVQGWKFGIGLMEGDELIGVGTVGRPLARMLDDGKTLEVTRVCVKEGCPNACSQIYGRLRKIAVIMAYDKLITYTLQDESQSSLKGLGAFIEDDDVGGQKSWSRANRKRSEKEIYAKKKIRWNLNLKTKQEKLTFKDVPSGANGGSREDSQRSAVPTAVVSQSQREPSPPLPEKTTEQESVCPYCSNPLMVDNNGGQIFCLECGYMVGDEKPQEPEEKEE